MDLSTGCRVIRENVKNYTERIYETEERFNHTKPMNLHHLRAHSNVNKNEVCPKKRSKSHVYGLQTD